MSEATFTEAAALFTSQKYYEAVQAYARIAADASTADGDKARAFSNISACYASVKDFEKSLHAAEEALALQPSNVKAMGRVATAYEGLRHYEEAAEYFGRALQHDPNNEVYKAGRARVQDLQQRKRGIASAETKETYYYAKSLEKGKAAMTAGNYLEAVRHFGKALDLFPTGDDADADGTAKEARFRERAILLANCSAAQFKAGRTEHSADDALKATETDPTYARGYYRLACAKHKLKKAGESYDALKTCLELDPEHADAKALLTEVEPAALKERMTTQERAALEATKVAELKEQQMEEKAQAAAHIVPGRHAHASSYVYCTYCNESGHTRADCPMRRKRPRM